MKRIVMSIIKTFLCLVSKIQTFSVHVHSDSDCKPVDSHLWCTLKCSCVLCSCVFWCESAGECMVIIKALGKLSPLALQLCWMLPVVWHHREHKHGGLLGTDRKHFKKSLAPNGEHGWRKESWYVFFCDEISRFNSYADLAWCSL